MENDQIIWWIRSRGPDGEDLVEMYYKGRCARSNEGLVGRDVRVRPVSLGPGEYTSTVSHEDVLWTKPGGRS